ncbi:MAG: class I SAM-dependent methyltransferase [Pseudomonadota bacterium]
MKTTSAPEAYESWYHTPRGHWIGDREFILLQNLLRTEAGASLLDVGCGTGYFSRRFARHGLSVTGIDPDPAMLEFARAQGDDIHYMQENALALPFPDNAFDYTVAVTSLCFIDDPLQVLREMWRVTRHALVLGLLNRHSLLHWKKQGQGSYLGARWDTAGEVLKEWVPVLTPAPGEIVLRSAVFLPQGNRIAQWGEQWLPGALPWGGFLAVGLRK